MEVEVYADLLFLINAGMDGLCLLLTGKLLHRKIKPWRVLLGAILGGIYAVASLLLKAGQALSLLADLTVCIAMCGTVFGERRGSGLKHLSRTVGVYFLLSMVLGGIMTALYHLLNRAGIASLLSGLLTEGGDGPGSWLFLLLALLGGGISLWGGHLSGRSRSVTVCSVSVELDGKAVELRGMVDSGNLLRDPVGGRLVICADGESLRPLMSHTLFDVLRGKPPAEVGLPPSEARRVRVIPAGTATGSGLLYGFLPDRVTITPEGKRQARGVDAVVAVTNISAEGVEALVPSQYVI